MSSPGKPDLKAGHPPAVKVGGVRISGKVQHEKPAKEPEVEDEEYEELAKSPPKTDVKLLISGAPAQGNKDFPPEAVKHFHEKLVPTHQKNVNPKVIHIVQQPRKN